MPQEQQSPQSILMNLIVNTLSVFVVSYVLPGIEVDSFVTALIGHSIPILFRKANCGSLIREAEETIVLARAGMLF